MRRTLSVPFSLCTENFRARFADQTTITGDPSRDAVCAARQSAGAFPVCTEVGHRFSPFCLPHDGDVLYVDARYYVTWNADFYPLNASITIELTYLNESNGDSAFTSQRTENSYGYIPLDVRKEWLQGKPRNNLTLYIIELDPNSDRRASTRRGPTIIVEPKPIEHYQPPPQLPSSKIALFIGLPVTLGVVVVLVASMIFNMRESKKLALGSVLTPRRRGYGIGASKSERLRNSGIVSSVSEDDTPSTRRFTDDTAQERDMADPEDIHPHERAYHSTVQPRDIPQSKRSRA